MRESPSIEIVQALADIGFCNLHVVEPHAARLPDALRTGAITHHHKLDAAVEEAVVIAILVPHRAFEPIKLMSLGDAVVIDPVGYTG